MGNRPRQAMMNFGFSEFKYEVDENQNPLYCYSPALCGNKTYDGNYQSGKPVSCLPLLFLKNLEAYSTAMKCGQRVAWDAFGMTMTLGKLRLPASQPVVCLASVWQCSKPNDERKLLW